MSWIEKGWRLVLMALLIGSLYGCATQEEGPAEQAGEKLDHAVEEPTEAMEEAGESIEEYVEDAGTAAEDAGDALPPPPPGSALDELRKTEDEEDQ